MKKKLLFFAFSAIIIAGVCITLIPSQFARDQVLMNKTEALSLWECDRVWWQPKGRCMDLNDGTGKVCIEIFDFDYWPGDCTTQHQAG